MHAGGPSATMQNDPTYDDVVEEVRVPRRRSRPGQAAGVEQIWVDPGVGFGKTLEHNLDLVANLDMFTALLRYCWVSAANAASGICTPRATPPFTAVFPNPSRPTTAWRVRSPWPRGVVLGWTWSSSRCAGYRHAVGVIAR